MFVGFGYHFDRYDNINDARADSGETTPFTTYSLGYPTRTQGSGVSANVLADTRDNPINAHRGLYWNASMRAFLTELGSDDTWQQLWSDFRWYGAVPKPGRNVLAIWTYQWFTFGRAPYLNLPATGWDTYGRGARGYLQGRIRATNQIYSEFEYRMQFTRDGLWGGVAFLNLTSSSTAVEGQFGRFDPGGGAGLRMKFNKRTDTNLAVDGAVGADHTLRLFFGLQEVF
jgi:hypothetical protein